MKEKDDKVHDQLRSLATRWSAIVQAANKPVRNGHCNNKELGLSKDCCGYCSPCAWREAEHNRKQLKIIQDLLNND